MARPVTCRATVGPSWAAARRAPGCTTEFADRGVPLAAHGSGSRRAIRDRTRGAAGDDGPGHAAVRFSNPTTGGDVMPTIRAEFHRLRAGAVSELRREVGTSVWQVFAGSGSVWLGGTGHRLERGDLFAVPSWAEYELTAGDGMDLFRFSDAPIYEALGQYR